MTILSNAYCTVAELKIHVEETTDISDEMTNKLEQAIMQASRFIDTYTGRIFYQKTLTAEKVDMYSISQNGVYLSSSKSKLVFPAPIISISSITDNGESLVEDTDFFVYNPNTFADGRVEKASRSFWTSEQKAIIVSGVIGYATTPYEIKNICIEISALIIRAKESFLTSGSGDLVGQFEQVLPKLTWKTLQMLGGESLFEVTFKDDTVKKWIDKNEKELPAMAKSVVNQTSAYGLSQLRMDLPKRSGNLRNSYTVMKQSPYTHVIFSPSRYADSMESGSTKHDVAPKNGHTFLTVPLNDSVLTSTKAQIKKASMDKLFRVVGYNKKVGKLYSKIKDTSVSDQFEKVGIALARKVTIPEFGGLHTMREKTAPKIDAFFINKTMEEIRKING